MKKWHWSVIAVLLYAVVEGWPAFKQWKMERDFLSDDLVEIGQCIVALEYVSPDIGQADPSWSGEARELYNLALGDAARTSGDEVTNVDSNMSIARYQVAVGARLSHYSNLAINKAREDVGWGTGEINGRLVKKWVTSELCQKARNIYLEKIRTNTETTVQSSADVNHEPANNRADSQTVLGTTAQNPINADVAVPQQTKESVVVKEVNGYSESGDGYTFDTQTGKTYYLYNAGGAQPRPGEELIKPSTEICLTLNPEDGMGDVSSVTAGLCSQRK